MTRFKNQDSEGDSLREQYGKLVEVMPQCAVDKLGEQEMGHMRKRFDALTNLTRMHTGELVATDQTRDYWRLVAVVPGFARAEWGEQFWCFEGGGQIPESWDELVRQEAHPQWWANVAGQHSVLQLMAEDRKSAQRHGLSAKAVQPDWDRMRFRHVCPCVDTEEYAWVRHGAVVSVGELFMILGQEYTAAEIYTLYRCLRIVCLKRRKGRSGGHSALGSAVAGVAPHRVLQEHKGWRQLLIEEYATLKGQALPARGDQMANENMFKAAVQYIHVNLLQDLSPPWIGHNFSQALPGDGVLARYLKPTFLRWPLEAVGTLFGREILETWNEKCNRVDLDLGAVVGRPLYVCTRKLPSRKVCGRIAAMSPLMDQRQKHTEFVCKDCAVSCDLGEHQALPVLRLVRLYAQVWVEKPCLAMRRAPMHFLVHAPKEDGVWGVGHRAPAQVHDATPASPGKMSMLDRGGFTYNDRESQNIWLYASHFQDLRDDDDMEPEEPQDVGCMD